MTLTLEELQNAYRKVIKGIDTAARDSDDRAYGGIIRAGKGKLVENIVPHLVMGAWADLGGDSDRLSFHRSTIRVPIQDPYIRDLSPNVVRERISENRNDYSYPARLDVPVQVDGETVLGIECKTYTENAMLKRILVDFRLLKERFPRLKCALVQLESQLGGDYSDLEADVVYGSTSSHTLMSYFPDVNLTIITLLEGERRVDAPIHLPEHYKDLHRASLEKAQATFGNLLRDFI